jgi:hypothetical protein
MSHNRLVYSPQYVAGFVTALRQARAALSQMHFRHLCQMADLGRELAQMRAELEGLRSATLARQRAAAEVADLRRLQAIGRARAAERDPATPLN